MAFGIFAAGAAPATAKRPNLVLITTDDQPLRSFNRETMPSTFRRLVDRGTSFTDAIVNTPLCCPSRATLLTGQYPHNTGVVTNSPGYPALRQKRSVLPIWLRRAGYRTAHVGKWLHGYEGFKGARPAPGWDRWYTQMSPRRYRDYRLSADGRVVRKGRRARDHLTPVMTREAVRVVRRWAPKRRPLFLQLDFYAPHRGSGSGSRRCVGAAQPAARDERTIRHGGVPRVPSLNEKDVTDKPYYAQLPALEGASLASLDRRWRCTLESLAGVDRGIERVFRELRRAGEVRDTAFVFLTDNGYFAGEHRFKAGKTRPLEEAIRTPLVLRPPRRGGAGVASSDLAVAAIDVAPTLLELARARPCGRECRTLDGRSLLGPARGEATGFEDRALLVEFDEGPSPDHRTWSCAFTAVRSNDDVLVENTLIPDRERGRCEEGTLYEHYDLAADPYQLDNRVPAPGLDLLVRQLRLLSRLDGLRDCAGIEGRDPPSQGGFCE